MSRAAVLAGRQPLEVLFDRLAVVGRVFPADLLERGFPLMRRQIAPAVTAAEVPLLNLTGATASSDSAVVHGAARATPLPCTAGAGAGRLPLLLLVFDLFDQPVERCDHALLDIAGGWAGATQIQSAANIPHPPGDMVERVVLEALDVSP